MNDKTDSEGAEGPLGFPDKMGCEGTFTVPADARLPAFDTDEQVRTRGE
jgi:hypothetical protein